MITTLELQELFPDVEMLFLDGHDNAILGIEQNNYRVAYSLAKILNNLVDEGMTYEEALEFYDFNIASAYVGEQTPIYIDDTLFMLP
jgi:hypothetical protein